MKIYNRITGFNMSGRNKQWNPCIGYINGHNITDMTQHLLIDMNGPNKTIMVDHVLNHFASCSGYAVEVLSLDS